MKDYLDLEQSALKYMMKCYPEEKEEEQMRRSLGRYGLTGKQQVGLLHSNTHIHVVCKTLINSQYILSANCTSTIGLDFMESLCLYKDIYDIGAHMSSSCIL